MFAIALGILNAGDEMIAVAPGYNPYFQAAELAEAKPVMVKTYIDNNFAMTADAVEPLITDKTKILVIINPCNPTGAVTPYEEVVKLSKLDSPVSNSVSKSGSPKDGGAIASTSTVKGGLSGAMLPAESVTVYVMLQVPLSNANPSPASGVSFPFASTQGTDKVSLVCSEDTNPEPTVVVVNPFLAKRVT